MRFVKYVLMSLVVVATVVLAPATAQAGRFSWWGPIADQATCTQTMLEVEDQGFAVAACRPNGVAGAPASPAGWYFPYFYPIQT